MMNLYSEQKIYAVLARHAHCIETLSRRYGVPPACIKAIVWQEMRWMDILDIVADWLVRFYWARYTLRKRLQRLGLVKNPLPLLQMGILGKRDSSTGYAQIFSYVAINAINFALDEGLADMETPYRFAERRLLPSNPDDLRDAWYRLYRDPEFNLEAAALNLLYAAWEMAGKTQFSSLSETELKMVFTRYNANVRHVTGYGEAAYRVYLRFLKE